MTIKVLPRDVSEKIAAGEVISRPASVVKELIENSIDAGASRISVSVEKAGRALIRVTDDGCGITRDQLGVAFEHHATSKVAVIDDLDSINTMGFRGEALPSVAAVSRTMMISRASGEELGGSIEVMHGESAETIEAGAPVGTTIEVCDLFGNLPARLKFLKSDRTEWGRIASVVTHAALIFPGVAFELVRDGQTVMKTESRGSLSERIGDLFGGPMSGSLIPVEGRMRRVELAGLISSPALSRSNMNMVHLFVNRRYVRVPAAIRAMKDAYGEYLPRGRCPVAFLSIEVPPGSVDVNVHPAKEEVRFRDAGVVHDVVRGAVGRALSDAGAAREFVSREERFSPRRVAEVRPVAFTGRTSAGTRIPEKEQMPLIDVRPEDEPLRCMQIHDSYIVVEDEQGLMLVDQHALHERVLLEELKKKTSDNTLEKQGLLVPINVELTPDERSRLDDVRECLAELGLTVEDFGGNAVVIRTVPAGLERVDPADLLVEIMDDVKPVTDRDGNMREVMGLMACRGAVKAGQKLSREEISSLVSRGRRVGFSGHCAHGRPTQVMITLAELERMFERT